MAGSLLLSTRGVTTVPVPAQGLETSWAFGAQCNASCLATFLFFTTWLVPLLFEELRLFLDLLSFFCLFVVTLAASLALEASRSGQSLPFSTA